MHRILHYVVIANRVRISTAAQVVIPQPTAQWNKTSDPDPAPVENRKEGTKIPVLPAKSSPAP